PPRWVALVVMAAVVAAAVLVPPHAAGETSRRTLLPAVFLDPTPAVAPTPTPPSGIPAPTETPPGGGGCDPSYPTVCIPPPPPDLDCGDIPYRRFQVLPPDPHNFDREGDGLGCE